MRPMWLLPTRRVRSHMPKSIKSTCTTNLHICVCRYAHPFEDQLNALPQQYPTWQLVEPQPLPAPPMKESRAVYVDTVASLQALASELADVREFAVDLEHSDRYALLLVKSLCCVATSGCA